MQKQEKTVLFYTERCVERHRLSYTLFENENGYGIAVAGDGETVEIEALTPDAAQAKQVLRLLADGTVFPQNVCEILDDLFGVGVL